MSGVLDGLKVIEMGSRIAIPAAGAIMGDWGADVIKVEPVNGEAMRGMRRLPGVGAGGVNLQFELLNRDKRSLALDLKKEAGIAVLYELVKRSDVFVANYEASTMTKLRLDYDALSQLNPRLIYAVVTGYGSVGPDKDERGFDFTAGWARSGTQALMTEPGGIPPTQRAGMCSSAAGMHAVAGICAALFNREKTGNGQQIEISLYHVGVYTIAIDIQHALNGSAIPANNRQKANNALSNCYRAGDDRWFELAMLQSDLYWHDLCSAMERPELESDPRFNSASKRAQNAEDVIRIMDRIFAAKGSTEWDRRFRENGVVYSRIEMPEEVVNDPQAHANGFFAEIKHPRAGRMKYVTMPVDFRQNPATVRTAAPEVGEHNQEILRSLGYTAENISKLKQQGVIP